MRIGLTYDLANDWAGEDLDAESLAEFDQPATIEAIVAFLEAHGHDVERIGRAEALLRHLAGGARWDLVFNICEGLHGFGREALVPALLDAHSIPYVFSDPLVLALCLHKAHCKRVLRDAGLPTAAFAVLARAGQPCGLQWPVFVKPLAEGTGKGIGAASFCHTPQQLRAAAARIIERFDQPALAEEWLPGREFTVGIIGTGEDARPVGVMEIAAKSTYGFAAKKYFETVTYSRDADAPHENAAHCVVADGDRLYENVAYRLVADAEARAAGDVALAAWRVLGCRDGGRIDLRSDAAGRPMFLEANPLAGLHPVDSDFCIMARLAGHDHAWLLARIMDAASARLGLVWR